MLKRGIYGMAQHLQLLFFQPGKPPKDLLQQFRMAQDAHGDRFERRRFAAPLCIGLV